MTDYQGRLIRIGDRIELHPACDLWMRGARFGTVTNVTRLYVAVQLDALVKARNVAPSNLRVLAHPTVLAAIPGPCTHDFDFTGTCRACGKVR